MSDFDKPDDKDLDEVYFRSFIGSAGRNQKSFFSVDHPRVIKCYVQILSSSVGYKDGSPSTIFDVQMRGIPFEDYVLTLSVLMKGKVSENIPMSILKASRRGNARKMNRVSLIFKFSEIMAFEQIITNRAYKVTTAKEGEESTFEIEFKHPQDAEYCYKVFDTLLRARTADREIKFPLPLGPFYPKEFSSGKDGIDRWPQLLTQEGGGGGGLSSMIESVTFSTNVQSIGLVDEKFDEEFSKLTYDQWDKRHYDYIFLQTYVQPGPTQQKKRKAKVCEPSRNSGRDGQGIAKKRVHITPLKTYLSSKKIDPPFHSSSNDRSTSGGGGGVNRVNLYNLLIQYFMEEENTFLNLRNDIELWGNNNNDDEDEKDKKDKKISPLLEPIFSDPHALRTLSYYVDFVLEDLPQCLPVSYLKVLSKRINSSKDELDLDELRRKLRYEHRHLWDVEFLFLKLMFSILYHFDFDDFVDILERKFDEAEMREMKKWRKERQKMMKRAKRRKNKKRKSKKLYDPDDDPRRIGNDDEDDILSFTSGSESESEEEKRKSQQLEMKKKIRNSKEKTKSLLGSTEKLDLGEVTFADLENFLNEESEEEEEEEENDEEEDKREDRNDEDDKFKSLMFDTFIYTDDYEVVLCKEHKLKNQEEEREKMSEKEMVESMLMSTLLSEYDFIEGPEKEEEDSEEEEEGEDSEEDGFDLLDDVTKLDPMKYESFISDFNSRYNLDTGRSKNNMMLLGGQRSSSSTSSGSIESFSFKASLKMKQNELRYKKLIIQNQNFQSSNESSSDYVETKEKYEKMKARYDGFCEKREQYLDDEMSILKRIKTLKDQIEELSSPDEANRNVEEEEKKQELFEDNLPDVPEREEKEEDLQKLEKKLGETRTFIATSTRMIGLAEKTMSQAEEKFREAEKLEEAEKEVVEKEMKILDLQIRDIFRLYLKNPGQFKEDHHKFLFSKPRRNALERLVKKRIREYTSKGRKDFRVIVKIVFSALRKNLVMNEDDNHGGMRFGNNSRDDDDDDSDVDSDNDGTSEDFVNKKLKFLHYLDRLVKPSFFEFGNLHTSILVKNIGIHWFSNSLVRVKELRQTDMYEDLLCLDCQCGTLTGSPQMLYKKILDLAHTIVSWNSYRYYSPYEIVPKGRRNCQQFTMDILRGLEYTPFFEVSDKYLEELKKLFLRKTFGGGYDGRKKRGKKNIIPQSTKSKKVQLDEIRFLLVDRKSRFFRKFRTPLRVCFESKRRSSLMEDIIGDDPVSPLGNDDDEEEEEEDEGEEEEEERMKKYYIRRHKDLDDFLRQAMTRDGDIDVNHPQEYQLLKGFDRAFAMKHFKAMGLMKNKILLDAEKEMRDMELYEPSKFGCPFDHKFVLKRKKSIHL